MKIIHSDCLVALKEMDENSIDSIVTDPPYGLSFMGKKWDYDVPSKEIWEACFRALKPGGHLLSFAGTRTQHRMAVNIEDAGFEIRDMIAWVYGSGFPKSHDVSKAIDREAGVERKVIGKTAGMGKQNPEWNGTAKGRSENSFKPEYNVTAPATHESQQWQGWGTALKPAMEPITVARKPLEGTVAENVMKHGTGAINVGGCRVGTETIQTNRYTPGRDMTSFHGSQAGNEYASSTHAGRWPANLIHDGSEEVVGMFPQADTISAARFFYCAKASKADRDEGCEGLNRQKAGAMSGIETREGKPTNQPLRTNHHPTVKPTTLMRYLCRLVTPPNGTILDPFMGSGSTGKAAILEGFNFIGIEREAEYIKIAEARIGHAEKQKAETLL
jgi:site-specific DNA-methyltransferase (adenine-specific)